MKSNNDSTRTVKVYKKDKIKLRMITRETYTFIHIYTYTREDINELKSP